MIKAYKYKLFPTEQQQTLLNKHFGATRYIYNWGLQTKSSSYITTKTNISRLKLSKQLTQLKQQPEYIWLNEINAQALQAKLEDLDVAYTGFFKKKADYPTFKSRKDKQSFRVPQATIVNFDNSSIQIPKFKEGIKFDNHRSFTGKICHSTISKSSAGEYYISITVDTKQPLPIKPPIIEATTIGLDLGLNSYVTISTGEKVLDPKPSKKHACKLAKLSRRHSRKQKGSNNKNKHRLKLAKLHEKVANQRKDFHHKLSYKLTHENQVDTIVMETLSVSNMIKNHKLAFHIADAGWSQFIQFIKYKCDWYGKNFIQIGRFEPSSKMCSTCGVVNKRLTLTDRSWMCASCGSNHDRDVNASLNIKKLGLVQPEVTPTDTK